MINQIYFFLPAILLLGIITSYEDIKYGKIKNKYIILAITYTILSYTAIIIYLLLSKIPISSNYLIELGTNAILSVVLAFLLFNLRIWAPGDAKLFIAYSLLVPLSSYSYFHISYFPSIILFTNIFIISNLFLIGLFLTKIHKNTNVIKERVLSKATLKDFSHIFLSLFSFSWIIRSIIPAYTPSSTFAVYLLSILFYFLIKKILKSNTLLIIIYIISIITRAVFKTETLLSLNFWVLILLYAVFFSIIKKILVDLFNKMFVKKTKISELKAYATLLQPIKKDKKILYNKNKTLLIDDILKLNRLIRAKKLTDKKVLTKETLPLAPFMFLGTIITILIQGEIVSWVVTSLK